jgi:hypothetical protein
MEYLIGNGLVIIDKKTAAHGDMSRLGGERHLRCKIHSYEGNCTLTYHHVACQAFFFKFSKKNDRWLHNYSKRTSLKK